MLHKANGANQVINSCVHWSEDKTRKSVSSLIFCQNAMHDEAKTSWANNSLGNIKQFHIAVEHLVSAVADKSRWNAIRPEGDWGEADQRDVVRERRRHKLRFCAAKKKCPTWAIVGAHLARSWHMAELEHEIRAVINREVTPWQRRK